jgi:hypothetical protein
MFRNLATQITKDPHQWCWVLWGQMYRFASIATNRDMLKKIVTNYVMILLAVEMGAAVVAAVEADMGADPTAAVSCTTMPLVKAQWTCRK